MSRSLRWAGVLLAAAAELCLAAGPVAQQMKNPYTGNAGAIEEGRRLYLKTGCYACHGPEAEGAVGPDLTDDVWVYSPTDPSLFNTIKNGRPGTVMAPWGDQFSAEEIWKVIAFIRPKYRGDITKIIW